MKERGGGEEMGRRGEREGRGWKRDRPQWLRENGVGGEMRSRVEGIERGRGGEGMEEGLP